MLPMHFTRYGGNNDIIPGMVDKLRNAYARFSEHSECQKLLNLVHLLPHCSRKETESFLHTMQSTEK